MFTFNAVHFGAGALGEWFHFGGWLVLLFSCLDHPQGEAASEIVWEFAQRNRKL